MHLFSVKFLQAPHLRIRLKTEEYTHQTYTKMIQIQGTTKIQVDRPRTFHSCWIDRYFLWMDLSVSYWNIILVLYLVSLSCHRSCRRTIPYDGTKRGSTQRYRYVGHIGPCSLADHKHCGIGIWRAVYLYLYLHLHLCALLVLLNHWRPPFLCPLSPSRRTAVPLCGCRRFPNTQRVNNRTAWKASRVFEKSFSSWGIAEKPVSLVATSADPSERFGTRGKTRRTCSLPSLWSTPLQHRATCGIPVETRGTGFTSRPNRLAW